MTLRRGHGDCAGTPRIEVMPANEALRGVQASAQEPTTGERRADGTFAPGARTVQSQGGLARKGKTRLARRLRLGDTFADPRFEPYARAARDFRRAHVTRLSRDVGGGQCGPAPASIIASAALQLAASRFAFEVVGDMALGSRLADASRQNLLAAHELCAREAVARGKHSTPAWLQLGAPSTAADASSPPKTDVESSAPADASAGQPDGEDTP